MSVSHPRYLNFRGSLPTLTPQQYQELMWGMPLPADELLTRCAEAGIVARLEDGKVVVQGRYWEQHIETARDIELLTAERAA